MNSPLVSIIIPTWNRGYCIEETIKSVLSQTHENLELLICDDGSTDNTFDLVVNISDRRLKWIDGQRGGRPAIPRNRGIGVANGEWIAFLDSDDIWLPNKLEMQITILEKAGLWASSSNALRLLPGKKVAGAYLSRKEKTITFKDLAAVNWIICSSAVIHRSLFDRLGFFPEQPEMTAIEDYAFWLRVATLTDFAYCPEPLLYYLDDPTVSVRKEGSRDVREQHRLIMNDFCDWVSTRLAKEAASLYATTLEEQWVPKKRKERSISEYFKMFRRNR